MYRVCTLEDEAFGPEFRTVELAREWAAINLERDAATMAADLIATARDTRADIKPYHYDYEAITAIRQADDEIAEAIHQAREIVRRNVSIRWFE